MLYPFGMVLRKSLAVESSKTHEVLDMDSGRKIVSIDEFTVDAERQRIYFYDFDRAVARLFADSKTARVVTLLRCCLAGLGSCRAQHVLAPPVVRVIWRGSSCSTRRVNNVENLP